MKLINVGLARTGTTSLKAALEILGVAPVYHTFDLFTNAKHMDIWEGAYEGNPVDWRAFYAAYEVADWPAGLFYKEIIAAHPEAKIMMTVRDAEGWYESIYSIFKQGMSINLPIPIVRRIKNFIVNYPANVFFEGRIDDRAFMVQFFQNYVAEVKAFVPEDRLLVYSVVEGWEPLCDFLDVAVPNRPFPRVNSRGGFKGTVKKLITGLKHN